jgi:hypothetical protein
MSDRRSVRIVIEGAGAEAAARDFFSRGWFEAEWERQLISNEGGDTPVVRADVLAIAAGSVTVAEKMLGWWESWRRGSDADPGLAVVVQAADGVRVALDTASRDSLVDVLRVLHAGVSR